MHEHRLKVGMRVRHRKSLQYVHSHYRSNDGRRIVQLSPHATAIRGDGIVCSNVLIDEIDEIEGPGESGEHPAL